MALLTVAMGNEEGQCKAIVNFAYQFSGKRQGEREIGERKLRKVWLEF